MSRPPVVFVLVRSDTRTRAAPLVKEAFKAGSSLAAWGRHAVARRNALRERSSVSGLVDHAVRERATRALERSFALSAGAGTGKTTVLVARLLELLRAGVSPARIAAITFTVKATGELVERLRDALEDALAAATGEAHVRLRRALDDFSDLTITTLHAFCQTLLQHEALEAGWAPGTEILAETLAPSSMGAAYGSWRRAFDARHPELAVPLRRLASEAQVEQAALTLLYNRDLAPVVGEPEPRWADLRRELRALDDRLLIALEGCARPDRCALVRNNRALFDLLATVRLLESDEAALTTVLDAGEQGNKGGGRAADWAGGTRDELKAAIDDLRVALPRWQNARWEPVHRALLLDATEHFLPAAERAKRASGQVDFQDLLFRASALLAARPAAAARLARRFDAILVDEVQDTDPIQSEIVARLARAPALEGEWNAHAPLPGKAFVVGDPKQSIYRFRRADVHQWRELTELVARDGETGSLSQCFRSAPGIVAFVNHVFADYPEYEPLSAFRRPGALDAVVALESGPDEADAVARHLLDLRARDARLRDPDTGMERPLRWSDVMLLLPAWTKAEEVQDRLLSAGIPSVVEGGRTFFGRDEVRLSIAALRAVEEPADAEAIVFVLHGLFGFSLDALAEHLARGGAWHYTRRGQPPGPVAEALEVLRALHARRCSGSPVALLDALLEHTRAPAVWSMLGRGAAMLANLDKLRMLVRGLEPVTRSGAELIQRLRDLKKQPDEDLPFVDIDSDAVRLTSYFKAKGLEAPVVVLCYASRQLRVAEHIVDRSRRELRLRVGKKLAPPGWDDWAARERAELEAERRRWMYVALTRAREHLVIVRGPGAQLLEADVSRGLPNPASAQHEQRVECAPGVSVWYRRAELLPEVPYAQGTFTAAGGGEGAFDALVDALVSAPLPASEALPGPAPDPAEEAWQRTRREWLRRSERACRRWVRVTELAASRTRGRRALHEEAVAGTVVHRVMEHLDFRATPEALAEQVPGLVHAFATSAGLSDELTARCHAIVERLLAHEVVDWARRAPEVFKEVPFAFPEGSRVVTGTIDLCFPTDEARRSWVVVDWKSHLPKPGTPERARYERQLELYARALVKNLTGLDPERVVKRLVGPHPELAVASDDEVLLDAHEALQDGLARLLADGLPAPRVGLDLGDPVIATDVELVWPEPQIALALDLDAETRGRLRAAGWDVLEAATDELGWADRALRRVAERFGLLPDPHESAEREAVEG
jgi:ATP-dependent helicase/nuclease subunit A